MLGVCIGVGGGWDEVAEIAASRMQAMTGVQCIVVKEEFCSCVHPSWLKATVIDQFPNDSFMVFDADIVCLKPWSPYGMFEFMRRPFMAVPDTRMQCVYDECEELGIAFPDVYVNGGLTIFGREHKAIWDDVWKKHPKLGRWLEQGALNVALLERDPQMCRLPRRFNWVSHKGMATKEELEKEGVINLHACSLGTAAEVREVQKRFGL